MRNYIKAMSFGIIMLAGGLMVGCDDDNDHEKSPKPTLNLVEVAQGDQRFTTLVQAVQAANLVDTLQGEEPLTVLAPTDAAFAAFLSEKGITAEALLASPELADILTYHVIPGNVTAMDAVSIASSSENIIETANGKKLALSENSDGLYANIAKVTDTDILASNGVIHAIDRVLVSPSNNALSDTDKTIAGIVTGLVEKGQFTQLLGALQASNIDLAATLDNSSKTYTVFAPTDAAFDAIQSTVDTLSTEALTNILLQHVVNGEVNSVSAYAANGKEVASLREGAELSIAITDSKLTVEGATVIITDIKASNGIIHVIDKVIVSTD